MFFQVKWHHFYYGVIEILAEPPIDYYTPLVFINTLFINNFDWYIEY